MKKIIIISTFGLLVVNLFIGLIVSSYHTFNVIASSTIIIVTGLLNYIVNIIPLKDAYRIAHHFLLSLLGVTMFLLMVFSPPHVKDNWCVSISVFLVLLEFLSLYITRRASRNDNNHKR